MREVAALPIWFSSPLATRKGPSHVENDPPPALHPVCESQHVLPFRRARQFAARLIC